MKTKEEIYEDILDKIAREDGWCAFCKNGLETGTYFCQDCYELAIKLINITRTQTLADVLSILKEGCGINFVLEEQDCMCGDDFEHNEQVKVLLCPVCLDKINRIKLLSKLEDDGGKK